MAKEIPLSDSEKVDLGRYVEKTSMVMPSQYNCNISIEKVSISEGSEGKPDGVYVQWHTDSQGRMYHAPAEIRGGNEYVSLDDLERTLPGICAKIRHSIAECTKHTEK